MTQLKTTPATAERVESTLDLTAKLRQRTVLERIQQTDWPGGQSPAPLVVEFDPTTACNLACPDCISRDLLNQGYFSRERIRDLTREMVDAGVKAVVLIGGGEPLAHPEIGWVMQYLADHRVQIGLTTNGLLIHRYLDVIAQCVDWVRVSVDAGSAETFQRLRPSPNGKSLFDEVLRNMELLAPVRKGKLGYSFMLYSEGLFDPGERAGKRVIPLQPAFRRDEVPALPFNNVDEILQAAQIAKRVGCDYFELKPLYDADHFLVLQNPALMNKAARLADAAKALEDARFKVLFATKLKDLFAGISSVEKKDYHRCAVAHLRTLVTPSGVYVCPYYRGRPDKRIGDVTHTSFGQMWASAERRDVACGVDPSRDCAMHCIRHESNLMLEQFLAAAERPEAMADFDLFI